MPFAQDSPSTTKPKEGLKESQEYPKAYGVEVARLWKSTRDIQGPTLEASFMDITDEHDADEVDEIPWALWSQRIRDCPFADFGAATIQEAFHTPVGGLPP